MIARFFSGSWRTRLLGVVSLLTLAGTAGKALLDGDPATNPDWAATGAGIAVAWAAIIARDDKVSSEEAGASTVPPATTP